MRNPSLAGLWTQFVETPIALGYLLTNTWFSMRSNGFGERGYIAKLTDGFPSTQQGAVRIQSSNAPRSQ
jgi:hypothetical protein